MTPNRSCSMGPRIAFLALCQIAASADAAPLAQASLVVFAIGAPTQVVTCMGLQCFSPSSSFSGDLPVNAAVGSVL